MKLKSCLFLYNDSIQIWKTYSNVSTIFYIKRKVFQYITTLYKYEQDFLERQQVEIRYNRDPRYRLFSWESNVHYILHVQEVLTSYKNGSRLLYIQYSTNIARYTGGIQVPYYKIGQTSRTYSIVSDLHAMCPRTLDLFAQYTPHIKMYKIWGIEYDEKLVRGRIIPTGSIPGFLTQDNKLTTI